MKQRHKQLGLTVSLTGLLWSGLVLAEGLCGAGAG